MERLLQARGRRITGLRVLGDLRELKTRRTHIVLEMRGAGTRAIGPSGRLRAYAYGLVTAALVAVFALAEQLTERFVSDHSRLGGTVIELSIVVLAALAFRPLHQRVEALVETAFTKRRREARDALFRLQKELTSFNDGQQLLRQVVDVVDRHMSSDGCAIYLRYGVYQPEASSFKTSLVNVEVNDTLVIRLRSSSLPADPRTLESAVAGALAFPMMAGGALIGFLTLTPKRIEYDDEDRAALASFVEAAGLALAVLDAQLRSQDAPRTNLPRTLTSFVGRETEVAEIKALLQDHRLVTLVGAGGVGKTRTAVEVCGQLIDEVDDGVWIAELGPIDDETLVASTIARALNVPQSPRRSPLETIVGYLKHKRLVLVLDNCEHVIEEASNVATAILQACSGAHLLATSREGLHVAGEQLYAMPLLSVPPADRKLTAREVLNFGAPRLFADRAFSADRRFVVSDENATSVAEICRRLDGIPLAIELAAARAKVLSPKQLAEKLDSRFRVLTGGDRSALAHHQTMRALIDWSYDLLSDAEQMLLRRLSIFVDGCTLQSAAAVCGDDEIATLDLLSSLVDKSLVQAEPVSNGTRYRLLESTRQYARERLEERGEHSAAARAHATVFLALAEQLERSFEETPDLAWIAQVEPELGNWRAALEWTLVARGDIVVGQRLAGSLRSVWAAVSPAEGRQWLRSAVQAIDAATDEALIAKLDLAESQLDESLVQYKASYDAAERALTRYRRLDDTLGVMMAQRRAGTALLFLGRISEAEAPLCEALAASERLGLRKTTGQILHSIASARVLAGDVPGARAGYAQALTIARATHSDYLASQISSNLAEVEFRSGDTSRALQLAGEALDADRVRHAASSVAINLCNTAAYLVASGRYDDARLNAREGLVLSRDIQTEVYVAIILQHLAAIAGLRPADDAKRVDDRSRAARLIGFCDTRLTSLDVLREFTEQQEYDRLIPALRSSLGEDVFAQLVTEGSTWGDDLAVAEALLV